MDKFKNKYRIPSARAQWWDYANAGAYFITICTHNRECYFGNITNGKMALSGVGVLADVFWHEIKNHSKNVELGEFVVMPNHVHGILILTGKNGNDNGTGSGSGSVETLHATSLQSTPQQMPIKKNDTMANISPKTGSVSTIIRSYKSAVTKHAHRLGLIMEWQERFHDRIIRDDAEYQRIVGYIINNPMNWKDDKFYNNL
jgi:REP element-mobilizing transposase RayT